jgi:hypothetical protein
VLFAVTLVQQKAGTLGMALTVFGVVWIGVALAHGVLLRDLPHGGALDRIDAALFTAVVGYYIWLALL